MTVADFLRRRVAGSKRTLAVTLLANGLVWILFQAFAAAQSYDGPLIESHAHIAIYASQVPGQGIQYRVDAREGATELTAASYVSSLDRNNIKCIVGFHGIAVDDKQQELLDNAKRLLVLYPDRFILLAEIFRFNPLDWFTATRLAPVLDTGLFSGFGEIQFNHEPLGDGTNTPIVRPDATRFLNISRGLADRGLFVMAHPASRDGVENAVSYNNGSTTWIIHGPQVHGSWNPRDVNGDGIPDEMAELEGLLDRNPNLYYTLDIGESLGEFFQYFKTDEPGAKEIFLEKMNDQGFYNSLLEKMVHIWKAVIERHFDRFLWGTDMAFPTWQWDPEVIDVMMRFSRAFIGRLESSAAENYAYKNAERLLGGCPVPIDIKPGSYPNSINLRSGGTVPVAILTTRSFDARTVDPTTVALAGAPVKLKGKGTPMASFEDVNGDGLQDLVVHVSTEALQLSDSAMMAVLEGRTYSGDPVKGRDTVRVVP
ncbi:MAG: hypothetical protein HYY78_05790 [Betaproteobacteria bacterium]|nr:hypothetical protein [Betaproteobacteria bacterium]